MSSKNDGLKDKITYATAIIMRELQTGQKTYQYFRSFMPSGHCNWSLSETVERLETMGFIESEQVTSNIDGTQHWVYRLKSPEIKEERCELVDDLGLNVKTRNNLRHGGIKSIDDLTARTEDELLKLRFINKAEIAEIKNALESHGKSLS